jgi:hypothetical protein
MEKANSNRVVESGIRWELARWVGGVKDTVERAKSEGDKEKTKQVYDIHE